ncbi:MAG: biotin--[Selenomonas sp.]|nr:biotin--[acetyl-CoA-carboxylase] ligase [Selenomonas sp.]
RIICHEEIDSTNNAAKRLAREGAAEGTVVVAESQTGGKGRLERQFFSPKGKGIWFSVVLRPKFLPQEAPKCTLLAAVAVARAMTEFGLKPGIKWPNDLLYDNKKLVGILTEMSAEMDGINYIVIGTGINVNIAPEEFPEELRSVATSLSQMKGANLPRVKFLQAVLRALDDLYAKVQVEGFAPVLKEWRQYSITLGQEVKVIGVRDGEVYYGKAVDIDDEGALLVDTAAGRQRVLAGDVSIRPKNGKW